MHSKRVTLQEKDVKLARRIRGDFPGDKQNQYREGLRRFQVGAEIAGEADYDDRNRRIPGTGWLPKNKPKAAEAEQKKRDAYEHRLNREQEFNARVNQRVTEKGVSDLEARHNLVREFRDIYPQPLCL